MFAPRPQAEARLPGSLLFWRSAVGGGLQIALTIRIGFFHGANRVVWV